MQADSFDPRVTPARPDLAAERLRGVVAAERYVVGETMMVGAPIAQLRPRPDEATSLDSQLLFGERVAVYERKNGWAWVQSYRDSYVGYMRLEALSPMDAPTTHWVSALRAPVFSRADVKSPAQAMLPMNAIVGVTEEESGFARLATGGYLATQHISPMSIHAQDWVETAERCLGAPYLWAGRSPVGMDCSGLVQLAMQSVGRSCPRDADMQEQSLAHPVSREEPLRRGDLVFWKGHVGIMRNADDLLHANAHHMMVASEPLTQAIARIASKGSSVTSIRRLS